MKLESLIFDIDGTLWDSRALVAEGYNLQLVDEGHPELCVTAEDLKPLFSKVMTEIADRILSSIPESRRYGLMARCMERENRHLQEDPCPIGYPGVAETLELLSRRCRLFIVSNSQQGYPELCMEKLGIARLIEDHLCFGDTGTGKGQTIRTLIQRCGIGPCAYVGDTQGDYEAAREAGIPFLWCSYGFGTPEAFDGKLEQFSDLLKIVND